MQIINRILNILGVSVIVTAAALPVSAQQYRLPASHAHQHENLIANQRPVGIDANTAKLNSYLNDITQREALIDDEIFANYWDSQSVNPYAGVVIPMTKDIDVSGYVAPVKGRVTSNYGWRKRFGRMHRGIDLGLHVGDTVVSAFDGVVRMTKFDRRGYGYYVVVRHDNGMETVYGHLSAFLVKPNQRVTAGQPLALGGNTGRSTGPHLHFETRYLGLAINPAAIIDFENYVTHKDIFTFEKSAYEKSQKYGPAKKNRKAKASKSTKKRKSKVATSTKKNASSKSKKKKS